MRNETDYEELDQTDQTDQTIKSPAQSQTIKSPVQSKSVAVRRVAEYLTAAFAAVLCFAVSFYAKDGYNQIGNAKFEIYRGIMLAGCPVLLTMLVLYLVLEIREGRKIRISLTDGFVLAYLVLMEISVISGGYYGDALWGCYGWNMGMMSQLSFVLLYLFLSRFGRYYRAILTALCVAASIVYGIGILHRLLIDPIGFYDELAYYQKAQFLSTLGQASWYGSYLAVTLPVGIGVFLYARGTWWRVVSGVFTAIGFGTLVTQNSDSAYFALAGALLLFFVISAREREMLCRWLAVLAMFFGVGKVMYFLVQRRPNPEFVPDYVTKLVWTSWVTWVFLFLCLGGLILLHWMGRKESVCKYPAAMMERLRYLVPAAAILFVVGMVLLIVLQARGLLPAGVSDKLANISYFNWNDDWGNGRGRIWRFSARIFSEENACHKLFGVGPDCFNSYVNAYYGEEEALFWGEKLLTNAHNEWLNILINAGILGGGAYIGIYVTAIGRFLREHRRNIVLAGIAAACVSYMCYNFFCYQQVLCTPFIFMLMGMGESIVRRCPKKAAEAEEVAEGRRD